MVDSILSSRFQTTYEELKRAIFLILFEVYRFQTTYEELKHNGIIDKKVESARFQTTYEELKLRNAEP